MAESTDVAVVIPPPDAGVRHGSRARALVLAVVSAAAFGSAGVCGKAAMVAGEGMLSPARLAQFRITGAALVFLLLLWVSRLRRGPRADRRPWDLPTLGVVISYGLLAFIGVQLLYFVAISRMPVGIALLIEYLGPALVAGWALLVQHRPQHRATWYGIIAALVGLALIAQPWRGLRLDGLGVLAALGAAVAVAAYFLIAESAQHRLPALPLSAWAAAAAALMLAVVLPWWSFPWAVLGHRAGLLGVQVPIWVLLLVVVVVGTVLAYLTGIAALTGLPAPVASVVATLEVVVASATAWVLLGEHLTVVEMAGGAVLLAGAVLAQRPSTARPSTVRPSTVPFDDGPPDDGGDPQACDGSSTRDCSGS